MMFYGVLGIFFFFFFHYDNGDDDNKSITITDNKNIIRVFLPVVAKLEDSTCWSILL